MTSMKTRNEEAVAKAEALMNSNVNTAEPDPIAPVQEPTGILDEPTPVEKQPDPVNVDWEHKYKVLDGMFKAERTKLSEQIKQLQALPQANTTLVANLQAEIERLKQTNSQLEQAKQSEPAVSHTELDSYLVDEYGEEFAQAVAKTANAQNAPLLQKLQHLENQLNSQSQSIQTNETDRNMTSLKATIKSAGFDFNVVNGDSMFHAWLSESDPYSGMQRQDLLEQAFNSGDTLRTARFYTDFMKTQTIKAAQNPFSEHVERLPNVSVGEEVNTQQPIFDRQAIVRLAEQKRRGQITDAEYVAAERKIFAQLKQQSR
jgi:hypothetical protein